MRDFGFRVATYDGMLTNGITLENDWITCFTKMLDTSIVRPRLDRERAVA